MKKKLIISAVIIISVLIVYLMISHFSVSPEPFDFIDHFDQAVFEKQKVPVGTAPLNPADAKMLDTLLSERCGRPMPWKLRMEISRFLSYNTTPLVKDSILINGGKNIEKGSFVLSLALANLNNDKEKDQNKDYCKIDIRSSETGKGHYLRIYNTDPVRIEISHYEGKKEKAIDAFSLFPGSNNLKLYVLHFNRGIAVLTDTSIWSYFKNIDMVEAGEVAVSLKDGQKPAFVKSVHVNRLNGQEKYWLFASLIKYQFIPDEDPLKMFSVWNELEAEDQLGGKELMDPHLRRIKLNQDTRRAVVTTMDNSFRFEGVDIPRNAVLEFAAAAHPKFFDGRRDLKFIITLSQKGVKLSESSLEYSFPDKEIPAWKESIYDLSQFAGKTLDITFRTETSETLKNPGRALVAWGDPVIRVEADKNEKNVILISLDTLGADHMGCFGYNKNTTPVIDKWAQGTTFFANSISNSSWTLPSHTSMLTSFYPAEAGIEVCDNQQHIDKSRIAPGIPSIASYLRFAGYKTYAITGGGYVSSVFGFDRGFNVYKEKPDRKDFRRDVTDALDFIEKNKNRKFFLFLHTFEIHSPYRREYILPASQDHKEKIVAAYDSGIFYADFHFGRLLHGLKKLGLYDKTLIILTSDHGEVFDHITEDSNYGSHGHSLCEPLIRVPLIMGGVKEFETGRRIKTSVSGVDIMPTVLDFLGVEYDPKSMRGMSLLPLLDDDSGLDRKGFSSNILGGKTNMEALRSIAYKLIRHIDVASGGEIANESEFYNLKKDPEEKINIPQSDSRKIFESELTALQKEIAARYKLLRKYIGGRGKYRDLLNALNIGGYVAPKSY